MSVRKIIVFGGSAGGIQSLCDVLSGISPDIAAALLAVIHTSERSTHLAEVLARCGQLEAVSPGASEPIRAGRLYVAAPNRHLVVKAGCVMTTMGPRENRHRPAIDTLFRTAARAYGSHVIAVVLSGASDDGSAGALAVKAKGGIVVVQDPEEAQVPQMPATVIQHVQAHHCLPAAEIPRLLARLVSESPATELRASSAGNCEAALADKMSQEMEPPALSCPECGGTLMEIQNDNAVRLRCHVGHSFSLETFSEAHADALERALWIALRSLNERRAIQERLAQAEDRDPIRKRYAESASAAAQDIRLLHEILARL